MGTENKLQIGDVSDNGQVTIVDEDRLCYLVKSESRGSVGLRTISKALLDEYVNYVSKEPYATANDAREALCGKSEIDKFEYGYTSTLVVMAKMILAHDGIQEKQLIKKELFREKYAATFLRKAMQTTLDKDVNFSHLAALNQYEQTSKRLRINGFGIGCDKNHLPPRADDYDISISWVYESQEYVLYLEFVPADMEKLLFPAYNEAYQGKFEMLKDTNGDYVLYEIKDFLENEYSDSGNKFLQQIFYGAPGTEYIRSYLTALRTKPFMLLAGISGTGKSRIVRKLAQATTTQKYDNDEDRWKDNRPENFELIQVKPNWHNSMDVVGFYSNISGKYEFTPFVEFIVKAWQHQDTPYFLCLDEMNLAPVEEYFAEFLSAIESRSIDENGDYITDPIIKPFKKYGKDVCEAMLRHLLGEAHHTESNPLAVQFSEKGLTLPPNLMVMGTVNMDETTFSFSRKVLDRAMSVEMNEVDYDKFLSGESEQFPLLTDMNELLVNRPQRAAEVTEEIESEEVIAYLKDVNTLMGGTPFKLGYRAANEAMLYVAACKKFAGDNYVLAKALDEFTLMKILSRIEGDDSRLGIADDDPRIATLGIETSEQHTSLLTCLKAIVQKHIGAPSETEKKIDQMCNTLEREHFVSYWA
jgi:hypothetical protein